MDQRERRRKRGVHIGRRGRQATGAAQAARNSRSGPDHRRLGRRPSGIATYSQAGAQFGYDLGWTLLFSWPLMCAIQEISARIGRVTGRGIAGNLKRHYPAAVVYVARRPAGGRQHHQPRAPTWARWGRRSNLVIGGPTLRLCRGVRPWSSVLLEIFVRYSRYVSVLKWLTLSLFAYVGVAFVVTMPWATVGLPSGRAEHLARSPATSPWWWRSSAPPSAPTCSSGRPRRRWRTSSERPGAKPLVRAPEQAKRRVRPHPHRHLSRHGALQHRRAVHHDHHRRDPARPRHHRYPDLVAGRDGPASPSPASSPS